MNYPIFALRLNGQGDLVAQLVEQYTFNVWVLGSSPSQITEKTQQSNVEFFFICPKLVKHQLRPLRGYIILHGVGVSPT